MAQSLLGSSLQRARVLRAGDKLGKHELIGQIAVGGMAELYLARTTGIEGFEKLVVVKRILPQYADNASFVGMFLNEARLAATLHHPNIAQVYDIGQERGEYFFSMEYVHGEDLGRLIAAANEQGVPISLDVALTLVTGLCAGMHHAHEQTSADGKPFNIVHRDISPSNVLVSYDGSVKLVDFGIARASSRPTTAAGGLKGKIAYMSPEQCRGNATIDRRSDIFSVGALLYELTTGQLPFDADSEFGVLNLIVNEDAAPPGKLVPSYPPALERIVLRALARDVDQRYETARALQGELEDFAHDNRLRVSPLVLTRLMENLFPERREQWDAARTQGAFFVEQHVVRTLIEGGKSGERELTEAERRHDRELEDLPTAARQPMIPQHPQVAQPGTLVSNPTGGNPVVRAVPIGGVDVTERVRIPTATKGRAPRAIAIACAAAAVAGTIAVYIATREPDAPLAAMLSEREIAAPPQPPLAAATVAEPPPVPPPAPRAAEVTPEPTKTTNIPAATTTPPPPKKRPIAAPKRPARAMPKVVKPAAPKQPTWSEDSPFMPVRPGKP